MSKASSSIADIRSEYMLANLDENAVGNDPIVFFKKWFADAQLAQVYEVNAMTLATVSEDGQPHARIVLLKGIEEQSFLFFTNYHSNKGQQITQNNKVALVFFWKELERQVRVEGTVQKLSETDSEKYFQSRPKGSQIGAWASPQSQKIDSRAILENEALSLEQQYANQEVLPKPPHWGGYSVTPHKIEFWQGRESRLHDRIVFELHNEQWNRYRLAP